MRINANYRNIKDSYLFSTIGKKVSAFTAAHPEADVIRLGIGDVTRPLSPAVVEAMANAARELGTPEGFHGYIPSEQGYSFLREAIAGYYAGHGVMLSPDEIFISDGAKSDLGNLLDLFDADNTVLIPDPVYPAYVDANVMAGRRVVYCDATVENGFLPLPDDSVRADLIYICSPNNPTGAVYGREGLKKWVDYALKNDAILLFDAAYEAFIGDPALPRSIYEIEGAKRCAIEVCSFSKMAGFTGTRCGWTVVPEALVREGMSLNRMWMRRQTTKYNGTPYIIHRAAEAVFTDEGYRQCMESIAYYKENARIMADTLDKLDIFYTGGINSPYIWLRCPGGLDSWTFFDKLLEQANVVGTPGEGFGANGEGFFRLTAFNTREKTAEAMQRFECLARSL